MKIQFINNINYVNNLLKQAATTQPQSNMQYRYNLSFDTFEKSQTVSFLSSTRCSVQNFQVKNIKNIRCPVCGLITLTDEQVREFINDVAPKKGQDLKDAFEKYEDESVFTNKENPENKGIYRPIKQQAADIIKELAVQNPDLDLRELVKLKANECIGDLISKQVEIIEKMKTYARQNIQDKEAMTTILDILEEHEKRAKGESDTEFANKRLFYALKNANCDPTVSAKLLEIAQDLPTSKNDIYSFFVKYSKPEYSAGAIASKFVAESIPTAEHLVPRSNNGANKLENYICDCADCNSRRSSTPFYIWQESIPDFEFKLQKYLEEVQGAIDDGTIEIKYQSYIENIIDVIEKLSQDEISLSLPDSTNAQIIQESQNKRQAQMDKIYSSTNSLNEEITRLKDEITQIENLPQFRKIVQCEIVAKRLASIQKKIRAKKEEISSYKSQKDELQKALSAASKPPRGRKTATFQQQQEIARLKQSLLELAEKSKKAQKEYADLKKSQETLSHKDDIMRRTVPTVEKTEAKLKKQKAAIAAFEQLLAKESEYEKICAQENELKQRIEAIESNIKRLNSQNAEIEAKDDFDKNDKHLYHRYEYLQELLQGSYRLYNELDKSKKSKTPHAKEIIDIAKDAIQKNIEEMLQYDSVIYFVNLKAISDNSEDLKALEKKLSEITASKKLLNDTITELTHARGSEDIESLKAKYGETLEQYNLLLKIRTISERRQELEMLEDTKEYNQGILQQLRDFNTLSNEEFKRLISSFYYES